MTFSAEQYRENIGKNEPLPKRTRSYFQQRFQQQVFARLAKAFADRAEEFEITKSGIATLLDKDKAQINRILSHPTNLTLDTIGELAFALNYEPVLSLEDLSAPAMHNFCHPAYEDQTLDSIARFNFESAQPPTKLRVAQNAGWILESVR